MLASWIVTSHRRPDLLAVTLKHLWDMVEPPGWTQEIVVACYATDEESVTVAQRFGAHVVVRTGEPHPSGKRNAALHKSSGELVLTTDDDDFQSPMRLTHAVAAYQNGHQLSGIREFRRLHLATGNVVRYLGRGTAQTPHPGIELPPVMCGTARNYARKLLERHHGWNSTISCLEDHDLHRRITKRRGSEVGVIEYDMGDALADRTIICQHGSNIVPRPDVPAGKTIVFGAYLLVGEGHWSTVPRFPKEVADALVSIGRLA